MDKAFGRPTLASVKQQQQQQQNGDKSWCKVPLLMLLQQLRIKTISTEKNRQTRSAETDEPGLLVNMISQYLLHLICRL